MKTKNMMIALVLGWGLFTVGGVAQHEEQDQSAKPMEQSAKSGMDCMMCRNMMGQMPNQMPKMMMGQNDTGKLVGQLTKSFAAIQAEKDPAALKSELARHGALLKELQSKTQTQSRMMAMMHQTMAGPMMGGSMPGGSMMNGSKPDASAMCGQMMEGKPGGTPPEGGKMGGMPMGDEDKK